MAQKHTSHKSAAGFCLVAGFGAGVQRDRYRWQRVPRQGRNGDGDEEARQERLRGVAPMLAGAQVVMALHVYGPQASMALQAIMALKSSQPSSNCGPQTSMAEHMCATGRCDAGEHGQG